MNKAELNLVAFLEKTLESGPLPDKTMKLDAKIETYQMARNHLDWLLRVLEELEAQDRDGHTKA
jgi:hypothetical protein